MNPSADLQERIARVLDLAMPPGVPVVRWRKRDRESDMEAITAARQGLCIYVPMPLPTHAMQGTPVVFFDEFECRVQIVEIPNINSGGTHDLYDLIHQVSLALHWQPKMEDEASPLAGILAHPLYIAERPVDMAEGVLDVPGFERQGEVVRAADVIFHAVLELSEN